MSLYELNIPLTSIIYRRDFENEFAELRGLSVQAIGTDEHSVLLFGELTNGPLYSLLIGSSDCVYMEYYYAKLEDIIKATVDLQISRWVRFKHVPPYLSEKNLKIILRNRIGRKLC